MNDPNSYLIFLCLIFRFIRLFSTLQYFRELNLSNWPQFLFKFYTFFKKELFLLLIYSLNGFNKMFCSIIQSITTWKMFNFLIKSIICQIKSIINDFFLSSTNFLYFFFDITIFFLWNKKHKLPFKFNKNYHILKNTNIFSF